MIPWAFLLAQAGYRAILVDLRGHGRSTGQSFSCGKYECTDLIQLLDYLVAQHICDERVGVLGLSFGADLALHWAARDPRIRTVVAIAPYNRPEDAMVRFAKEMKIPISSHKLDQAMEAVAFKLELNWDDLSGVAAMKKISRPVFLIGGEKDLISPPEDLNQIKQVAAAGTKLLMVPEANHFVIGFWFHEIADPVTAWFQAQL